MAIAAVSRLEWRRRTETSGFVLLAVGVAGTVATAFTAWAVANSPILVNRSGDVIWRSLFVAPYVAVGEYTWWRRPESPLHDAVRFTVADDGVGMDIRGVSDGVGLAGMRDRIGAVGGELEVISSPGRGTTVRGVVPDADSAAAPAATGAERMSEADR